MKLLPDVKIRQILTKPQKMIKKKNGKFCVIHGHPQKTGSKTDKPKGSTIKCFDTLKEAQAMHQAIIISQQKKKNK